MPKLIAIEDDRPIEIENEIPLEMLVKQHRLRYLVSTSQGQVVFKFIGALRRRTVELNLSATDPEYEAKRRDLQLISATLKAHPMTNGLAAEQLRLAALLEPSFYAYFAGCFVHPALDSEGVQAFADSLPPEEWRQIRVLLLQLIAARPSGDVASAMLMLCNKYGVRISDSLTMENMTAQQMAVLDQAARDEAQAVKEAMKR